APTLVQVDADVEVTQSAPSNVLAGQTITITVSAIDHGPRDATGVAITDLLPAGFTFVSAAAAPGSYNSASGVWSVGSLASGATSQLAIQVTAAESGSITNLALKTGQNEPDPETANDSAAAITNVAAAADLAVGKVVDRTEALVGDTATFTVTVANRGPSPATGVAVADTLPSGFTLTSATPAQGSYNPATGTWTIGAIPAGAATTLTMVGTLTSAGVLVNNASISSQVEIDPNPLNNSSAASINAAATADLRVLKDVSQLAPAVGSLVTFTITLTNLGPSPVTNATVRDLLPAGLTFVSATASQGTYAEASGDWTIGVMPVTRTETLAITARVTQAGAISNAASVVGSAPGDPNPANDSAVAGVTSTTTADLAVTSTPSATSVAPGAPLTWTIVATNAGPDAASGAHVDSTFPAALTGVTWTCTATAGSSCPTSSGT